MAKVYLETYGCSANTADAEIMSGLLTEAGFNIVNEAKDADLYIIVTCIVKTPTEHRMSHRIRELGLSGKPLIVAGCMPQTERRVVEGINLEASLLGPGSVEKVVEAGKSALNGLRGVYLDDLGKPKLCLPRLRRNPFIGIIQVATGCLSRCSFCEVRLARGRLRSYPLGMVVQEAREALRNGCKELWLTSQDNSCYGRETGEKLPELITAICQIEGRFFIRIGMMNPRHLKGILKNLLEVYGNAKVFKFLHLPVQSGSLRILNLMRRGYTPHTFQNLVGAFREVFPNLTLATDIIVGFPTETQEDFNETIELIKDVEPDIVNVSKFGARPGTEAARITPLPQGLVNDRTRMFVETVKGITSERNRRWLGWVGQCLIDERGSKENTWIGRNSAYKPILVKSDKDLIGRFIDVEIVSFTPNYLIGESSSIK